MTSSTVEQVCRRFSVAEIESATEDFSDAHLIGKGGFGSVYKGLVNDGETTVAIKRLSSNFNQGEEQEFAAEMKTLTQFRHYNLVSLIGYCCDQGEMMLVYEYMENGTLADHLYKPSMSSDDGGYSSLTWNERLKICIGAGRGLDYLHSGCLIIHRDVKSTNILLDKNFIAKVADFGLAKHLGADLLESHVIASVMGSFGYFDPSYLTTCSLTRASDIYAFGVVLLEVLSGRPAIDAENNLCLAMWAQEKIRNGKVDEIVASNLRGEISDDCLKTFVGVAKRCLHHQPKKRLTMTQAVAHLEVALEQQERKGPTRKVQFPPLNAFWSRVIPSGSKQKHHNKVEVNVQSNVIPAIRVDVLEDEEHHVDMLPKLVPTIPLAELKDITQYFSSKCLIAESGRGSLFRGLLRSGQSVALKKLYNKLSDQLFLDEVSTIASLEHENVVQLLGYCADGGLQVFVYEFAPRGSLHDILHGQRGTKHIDLETGPTLSWAQRIKIAIGAAKGLLYVHDKEFIHRSIKSSNVLLFDDEIAKITDLHLVAECPRFGRAGVRSEKGDIYGFGVVLLELLTGHKPFDHTRGAGHQHLVTWAMPRLEEDKVQKIVDARLKGDYPPSAAAKMAAVAAACVQYRAEGRPNMSTVIQALQICSQITKDYLQVKNMKEGVYTLLVD